MADQPTSGTVTTPNGSDTPATSVLETATPTQSTVSQDTANPATTQQSQPAPQQTLSSVSDDVVRLIRKQERESVFKSLERSGIEIVKNDKGHRDLKASVDAFTAKLATSASNTSTATATTNDAPNTQQQTSEQSLAAELQRKAQQQELEAIRAKATEAERKLQAYEEQLAKATAEKEDFIIRSELTSALQPLATPTYFDDAVERFFREYRVEKTEDGTRYWIDSNEQIIVGANGKPATVSEVAQQFLQRFPRYAAPTANPGASPAGVSSHGVIFVTAADIAAGKVKSEDLESGRVKIR